MNTFEIFDDANCRLQIYFNKKDKTVIFNCKDEPDGQIDIEIENVDDILCLISHLKIMAKQIKESNL